LLAHFRLAGGVANAGGEVPDDQHGDVARILKRAQLPHWDAMAHMDFSPGGVNAQLYPQRAITGAQPGQEVLLRIIRIRLVGKDLRHPPVNPLKLVWNRHHGLRIPAKRFLKIGVTKHPATSVHSL
jgi:hypothetical protein